MQITYGARLCHVGRLPKGSDLLAGLIEIVQKKRVKVGILWVIGALESVSFAYYDQIEKTYRESRIEKGVEILSLMGNISERDGKPFIHAHIVVGDESNIYGGHLVEGSKVFAAEYHILELEGSGLLRKFDPETGLFLWSGTA